MLTQKRLREKLRYDPATGIFTFAKGKRRGKVAGSQGEARLQSSLNRARPLTNEVAAEALRG